MAGALSSVLSPVSALVGAVGGLTGMLKPPKIPEPAALAPPPEPPAVEAAPAAPVTEDTANLPTQAATRNDAVVRKNAEDERRRLARTGSRASTILTSGRGVTNEVAPYRKTLMGQ